ncbi:hypothetical protein [Elioraea thermophila]|uniref:hypothetical protein n=1 Tax=Elioraea thermophila TaxID=2185104 RepID=UPI000DF348F3|nr:hypothetical protein [Elioraea thermophila]
MTVRVRTFAARYGGLLHVVPLGPEALPAVSPPDLLAAWQAARAAAEAEAWGEARALSFRRRGGEATELVIADPDARCWAAAVDHGFGLDSLYGLAVCLRLLGLIELLASAPWARGLFDVSAEGTEVHPALLGLVATAPLGRDGRFDAAALRARLASRLTGALS